VTELPLVSVIISSYTISRLNDILELLKSLTAQKYPLIEIIFVAERSPALLSEVKRFAARNNINNLIAVFNDGEPGLSAARNLGVKHASGEIIAFIDDDALPFPDWAEEMVKTYHDETVIGITGPTLPLWDDKVVDWFPKECDWIIGCSSWCDWHEMREVRNVWGMNMSFRREAFNSSGLFQAHLGAMGSENTGKHELVGEETEFSIRVRKKTGKRIFYNPNVRVRHRVYGFRATPMVIARRAYWEGYTKALFHKIYRDGDDEEKLLGVEYQLLGRILRNLLPSTLKGLFTVPWVACRRLAVTVIVLSSVASGYFLCSVHSLVAPKKFELYRREV
jgi:glycosyltransferase involved in cell wall biosynthesis